MKTLLTILFLIASAANAQVATHVLTWGDPLNKTAPAVTQSWITVVNTHDPSDSAQQIRDAYKGLPLRSIAQPALIDLFSRNGVTITGTLEQARADLATLDAAVTAQRAKDVMARMPAARSSALTNSQGTIASSGAAWAVARPAITNAIDLLWQEILLLRAEVEALR